MHFQVNTAVQDRIASSSLSWLRHILHCKKSFAAQNYYRRAPSEYFKMRICIYKSDRSPELTLMLQEGRALPADRSGEPWQKFKTVTAGEVRSDLLVQIGQTGYFVVRLDTVRQH